MGRWNCLEEKGNTNAYLLYKSCFKKISVECSEHVVLIIILGDEAWITWVQGIQFSNQLQSCLVHVVYLYDVNGEYCTTSMFLHSSNLCYVLYNVIFFEKISFCLLTVFTQYSCSHAQVILYKRRKE